MKTLSTLAFLAAAGAFAADAGFEVIVSVLFAAGLFAITALDYSHRLPALRAPRPLRRPQHARFYPPALTLQRAAA